MKSGNCELENNSYLSLLSRGGLFVPSNQLAEFVNSLFAILDLIQNEISSLLIPVIKSSTYCINMHQNNIHVA